MIKIQLRPNEPLESALRRFKRQCNYAGVFRLAKKYAYYEKRSDKRRREERERIRSIQRALRKQGMRPKTGGRRKSKMRPRPNEAPESILDAPAEVSVSEVTAVS
jgi:small subunit ribosomal protein S21